MLFLLEANSTRTFYDLSWYALLCSLTPPNPQLQIAKPYSIFFVNECIIIYFVNEYNI